MDLGCRTSSFEREAIRLRPMLVRLSISITGNIDDSNDIAQDTLLKLWHLSQKSEINNIDLLARTIARNASLNIVRSRKFVSLDNIDIIDDVREDSETLSDELLKAISNLPDTEQIVLRMKHIERMETDEIARIINSTPGAVRTALSRARRRIYNHFIK